METMAVGIRASKRRVAFFVEAGFQSLKFDSLNSGSTIHIFVRSQDEFIRNSTV